MTAIDLSKRLYATNSGVWSAALTRNYFSDKPLGAKIIENGIVLPVKPNEKKGGVCDGDFNFVAGLFRSATVKGWGNVLAAYRVPPEKIVRLDEEVIFGGVMMGHFGHFISECLIRLWYVIEHPEIKSKVVFVASVRGVKPFHYALFELMGIPRERIVFIDKPTQFRSIIVPDESNISHRFFTKELLTPYRAVAKNIVPGDVKKIIFDSDGFRK